MTFPLRLGMEAAVADLDRELGRRSRRRDVLERDLMLVLGFLARLIDLHGLMPRRPTTPTDRPAVAAALAVRWTDYLFGADGRLSAGTIVRLRHDLGIARFLAERYAPALDRIDAAALADRSARAG